MRDAGWTTLGLSQTYRARPPPTPDRSRAAFAIPVYALFDADGGFEARAKANGKAPNKIDEARKNHIAANRLVLKYFGQTEEDFPSGSVGKEIATLRITFEAFLSATLEQHCETEFNRIRATAFPRAYFEKDNDARSGSKGDYIFRNSDDAGTEIISIMFEMKNESDRTATKNKNEDFLKELDKDRSEKGCEYAVLVSLLEPDSELYNTGIVDVFRLGCLPRPYDSLGREAPTFTVGYPHALTVDRTKMTGTSCIVYWNLKAYTVSGNSRRR